MSTNSIVDSEKSSIPPHAGNSSFVQHLANSREGFPAICCTDSLHWEVPLPSHARVLLLHKSRTRHPPLTDQRASLVTALGVHGAHLQFHLQWLPRLWAQCPHQWAEKACSRSPAPRTQSHLWGCQYKQLNQKHWYETEINIYIRCNTRHNFLERRFEVLKYSKKKSAKDSIHQHACLDMKILQSTPILTKRHARIKS